MRQQLNLNKCVGITKSGELIMVDYLFNTTMNGEPFHGATGTRFMPITQAYIDECNDIDVVIENYGYLWEEAVKDGLTTDSQEDYIQGIIDAEVTYGSSLFLGHDDSSVYHIPDDIKATHFQGYETFECIGGGRMFPLREEMLIVFDEDLMRAVEMIEDAPYDLEMFADVLNGSVAS